MSPVLAPRRLPAPRRLLAALLLVAGLAGPGIAAPPNAGARALRVSRLLVYAQEWSLWSSRPRVPAGRVIVQLWNRGQDAHDLAIRRLGAHGQMTGRAQTVGVTESGQLRQARWILGPGTYELYCAMPGHMAAGMHARLVVTR